MGSTSTTDDMPVTSERGTLVAATAVPVEAGRHLTQAPRSIGPYLEDVWYEGKALAADLGISWQRMLNMRAAGEDLPPAVKLGRKLFFRGSDIVVWLDAQRETGRAAG